MGLTWLLLVLTEAVLDVLLPDVLLFELLATTGAVVVLGATAFELEVVLVLPLVEVLGVGKLGT